MQVVAVAFDFDKIIAGNGGQNFLTAKGRYQIAVAIVERNWFQFVVHFRVVQVDRRLPADSAAFQIGGIKPVPIPWSL